MKEVTVVIPIYKKELSPLEQRSLRQAYELLSKHPITVIKPVSLDLSELSDEYPNLLFHSFEDNYFKGIAGYNRLMLASVFYGAFLEYEYILIYQPDAWIFRDELSAWCRKGYDYIGAPWLEKPVYRLPLVSSYMKLLNHFHVSRGKQSKQQLYNKVGNGGFSLRKVKSHYDNTLSQSKEIAHFLDNPGNHFYYEDVFWATKAVGFTYPDAQEALGFSFDKYPSYCYKLTGQRLPFGCHAWYKRKMRKFWKPIIKF